MPDQGYHPDHAYEDTRQVSRGFQTLRRMQRTGSPDVPVRRSPVVDIHSYMGADGQTGHWVSSPQGGGGFVVS